MKLYTSIEARQSERNQAKQWLNDFAAWVVDQRGASCVNDLSSKEIVACGWAAIRAGFYDANEFLSDLDLEGLITEIKEDNKMKITDISEYIETTFLDSTSLLNELDEILEEEYSKQYGRDLDDVEAAYFADQAARARALNQMNVNVWN